MLPYFLYLSRKLRDKLHVLLSWKAKCMSGTSVAGRRYHVLCTYLAKGETYRSPFVFNVSFRNTQRKRVVSIIKKNHINVRRSSCKGSVSFAATGMKSHLLPRRKRDSDEAGSRYSLCPQRVKITQNIQICPDVINFWRRMCVLSLRKIIIYKII